MSPQQDEPSKPVKIDIIQDDLKVIEFDEVFDYTGHFGLYQLMVFCVLGLSTFQIGVHNIIATFLIAEVPAWCEVPRLKNFSYEQQTYIAIPYTNDKEEEFSKCEYYDLPWDDYTDEELVTWNRTAMTSQAEVTACDRGWVYDRHELSSTIITEWDLVCDKSWIAPLTITISLSAVFFGSFTWGSISDKFGRAPTFTIGNMITTVAGIAAVYSPNIIVFNILRLMSMFGANGSLMPGFVMVTETFGPRHRTWGGICFSMFFSLGFSILPWVAYFVRDFRMLLLTMTAPSAAIVCAYWILPESPRWLLSQGRQEEGMQILRQICTINNTHLPDNVVITVQAKNTTPEQPVVASRKARFLDLFSHPVMRKITVINFIVWFISSVSYYAASINTDSLNGGLYMNTFIAGVLEFPANTLCFVFMMRIGRRWTLSLGLLLGGVCLIACVPFFNTANLEFMIVILTMVGKAFFSSTFTGIFVFAAELFPTPLRNVGVGMSSMMAGIGTMSSPYFGSPLQSAWEPLPSLLIGGLSLAGGLLLLMLPETLGRKMPDTIQDVEDISRGKKETMVRRESDSESNHSNVSTQQTTTEKQPATITELYNKHTPQTQQNNYRDNLAFDPGELFDRNEHIRCRF